MRFRLTYRGPLRPSQQDPKENGVDRLSAHKHALRQCFHRQLKHLWATNKFLNECQVEPRFYGKRPAYDDAAYFGPEQSSLRPYRDVVATNYEEFGYRFVPLVRDEISLVCSLDILFLRRDMPGGVITSAGDLDNRVKTLIDALRRPKNARELAGNTVQDGEDPFFCLMEDDSQVDRLTVEADLLLDPPTNQEGDHRTAHVVISVEVRPTFVTTFNVSFVS